MTEEQNEQTTFNAEAYEEKMKRIDAEIRANNLADENESLQQKYLSESYEKSKLVSENNNLLDVINNQDVKIAGLEKMLAEQYPDLKQSLDWANERENENIKEITELKAENLQNDICIEGLKKQITDLESQIKVLEQNLEDTEICNKALEKKVEKLEERNKHFDNALRGEAFVSHDRKAQLEQAKEIIKNIIRVTWGEGWNYSLDVKVKAEQFIKEQENEKEN